MQEVDGPRRKKVSALVPETVYGKPVVFPLLSEQERSAVVFGPKLKYILSLEVR